MVPSGWSSGLEDPARDEWILIGLFVRFLRARKFDLAKAKIMLISAEQWRKDEEVDEIAKCEFPTRLLSC